MNFLSKIKLLILSHKLISIVILLALGFGGYYIFSPSTITQTSYVLGTVARGNIISSIDGSGQVASLDEVDIKPEASGVITWINVSVGQEVKQGQMLATIDDTDAKKAVADAELSLVESKLQLDKDIAQASVDYERKLESLQQSKDDLDQEYEDTFKTISSAFRDFTSVMTGIQNILYGPDLDKTRWNMDSYKDLFDEEANKNSITALADIAERDYQAAQKEYDSQFADFRDIAFYNDSAILEELLQKTSAMTKLIARAIKSETNLLDMIVYISQVKSQKVNSSITTFQGNLKSYDSTVNGNLSSLLSQGSSLKNIEDTITNTQRDIDILMTNNPTGINPISLQISKNNFDKKTVALADLKAGLADYVVRAPFNGEIAHINDIKKLDSVTTGTAIATLVTKQQLAKISLNEIDIVNVKVGQKASLTFDAVDGLTMTGKVSEVDAIGSVSQGVVNYSVKIVFDTQDERVKSGMSANASIIIDTKMDTLIIPSSAIKSSGGVNYVEVPDVSEVPDQISNSGIVLTKALGQRQIEVGVTNGTNVEILSGLKEGDKIVVRTISQSSAQTTAQTSAQRSNSVRIPGMGF